MRRPRRDSNSSTVSSESRSPKSSPSSSNVVSNGPRRPVLGKGVGLDRDASTQRRAARSRPAHVRRTHATAAQAEPSAPPSCPAGLEPPSAGPSSSAALPSAPPSCPPGLEPPSARPSPPVLAPLSAPPSSVPTLLGEPASKLPPRSSDRPHRCRHRRRHRRHLRPTLLHRRHHHRARRGSHHRPRDLRPRSGWSSCRRRPVP